MDPEYRISGFDLIIKVIGMGVLENLLILKLNSLCSNKWSIVIPLIKAG